MDDLVRSGDYADYGEVIESAIANHALLSQRVSSRGPLVLSDGEDAPTETAKASSGESQVKKRQREKRPAGGVPTVFSRAGLDEVTHEPASIADDVWTPQSIVPVSRWLFGQHNRFLPVKASCRALARLTMGEPSGTPLAEAASKIADAAAELGDYLLEYDRAHGLKRDEAIAIAFPHSGAGLSKGRLRYANQFVGSVNAEGVVSGMLMDLRLINWSGKKDSLRVRLTDAGWRLAKLANPILDGPFSGPSVKLTPQETEMLLDHIAHAIRAEDYAYRTLIAAIEAGANTPDALDEALEGRSIAGVEAQRMSRVFISTQRAGAISRMADLGLVARVRSGLMVTYAVCERGRRYVEREVGSLHA